MTNYLLNVSPEIRAAMGSSNVEVDFELYKQAQENAAKKALKQASTENQIPAWLVTFRHSGGSL